MQTLRPKKCKHCGVEFTPTQPLQNCHTYECFMADKKRKENEKRERTEQKANIRKKLKWFSPDFIILDDLEEKKELSVVYKFPKNSNTLVKNTKRSLNSQVIEQVFARDGRKCIICGSGNLDLPHHAFFWSDARYSADRNTETQLVTVCTDCHYCIHSKGDTGKRMFCKDYLNKKYVRN